MLLQRDNDGKVCPRVGSVVKVGDELMIGGWPFKVTYIHEGQNRMSVTPSWVDPAVFKKEPPKEGEAKAEVATDAPSPEPAVEPEAAPPAE